MENTEPISDIQPHVQERFALTQLSGCPSVWLAEQFLSPQACETLINKAKGRLARSRIYDVETGEELLHDARTSSLVVVEAELHDQFIVDLEERLAQLSRFPVENGENIQILNYQIGQEYRPHYDFFDPDRPGSISALQPGGQRVVTILMYLNTVAAGGECIFPRVGLSVAPRQGDALMFYNTYSDGVLDRDSLHSSLPVLEGEKWVATQWIREQKYSDLNR